MVEEEMVVTRLLTVRQAFSTLMATRPGRTMWTSLFTCKLYARIGAHMSHTRANMS